MNRLENLISKFGDRYNKNVLKRMIDDGKSDKAIEKMYFSGIAHKAKMDEERKAKAKAKRLKEIEDSKARVINKIKARKFNKLGNEIPFVGVAYINGKLVEYGYEPTFWNAHLRFRNGRVENVKEHFKVIRRKKM